MRWKVVGASVAGSSHGKCDLPCQDCFCYRIVERKDVGEVFVCVVSDGAGSAAFGDKGSEIVCKNTTKMIQQWLLNNNELNLESVKDIVKNWIEKIQTIIEADAIQKKSTPRDYACTILGTVVCSHFSLFFQIGDGAIVINRQQQLEVVFWPDQGEYCNMTHFVTDKDAVEKMHLLIDQNLTKEVALLTDGLQRLSLIYESRKVHTPFFEPMFRIMRACEEKDCDLLTSKLHNFLNSSYVNEKTDDDKTLVLATCIFNSENGCYA